MGLFNLSLYLSAMQSLGEKGRSEPRHPHHSEGPPQCSGQSPALLCIDGMCALLSKCDHNTGQQRQAGYNAASMGNGASGAAAQQASVQATACVRKVSDGIVQISLKPVLLCPHSVATQASWGMPTCLQLYLPVWCRPTCKRAMEHQANGLGGRGAHRESGSHYQLRTLWGSPWPALGTSTERSCPARLGGSASQTNSATHRHHRQRP